MGLTDAEVADAGKARRGTSSRALVLPALAVAILSVAFGALSTLAGADPVPEEAPMAGPTLEDVGVDVAQVENEEAEAAEERATPEAAREREESRDAFADLSASDAQGLLRTEFAEQLEALDNDPVRALSDAKVIQTYEDGQAATIEQEGETLLVEGSFPLRVEEEDGDLHKLDVSLEATPEGDLEPANPMTELSIPPEADEAIAIGSSGLAVVPVGPAGSEAERFGEKDVFYPKVALDTDRLVAPTTAGVEIFDLLRSAQSPEELRYELQLPEGATLSSEDGESAEVITEEGNVLARILPPSATDAQGAQVPVALEVQGSTIVLTVPHHEQEWAYPILVDPTVQENWYATNWYNGYGLQVLTNGIWQYADNHANFHGSSSCIHKCWGGSNRGLFVSSAPDNYGANVFGHWIYSSPNIYSYVQSVSIAPFWRDTDGCNAEKYPHPDDYVAFWNAATESWATVLYNFARYQGYANIGFPNEWPSWGHSFMVGLSTVSGTQAPCWRDLYVGGSLMYLSDWEAPHVDSVSGVPSGWVSDAKPFMITVNAWDKGLGVQNVFIHGKGTGMVQAPANKCSGTRNDPCLTSRSEPVTVTGDSFDEGEKEATASALDPLNQGSNSVAFTMRVDNTPPNVALGGQLAVMTDEDEGDLKDPEKWDPLPLPVYNLKIEATDGSLSAPPNKRSGVKSIEVFLDGKGTPEQSWTQGCPASSCAMTQTYTLKLNGLAPGKHTLKVKAYDQVGKLRERNIEFEYFPATGRDDEDYVMQRFPLPDGQDNETEEEHPSGPELAVNVMNGNLVYHERDLDVEGASADLEVERDYNSILATESTEWGAGWSLTGAPRLKTEEAEGGGLLGNLSGGDGGHLGGSFQLPTQVGEHRFDAGLQAVLTKEAGGSFEIADASDETDTALAFDSAGKVDELRTPGPTEVDYGYEGGSLSEIAVDDPAGTDLLPEEVEPAEVGERSETPIFSSSFKDEHLPGNGFSHPADIAVDPQGRLWVVDQNNKRVLRYSASGQYQATLTQSPLYPLKRPAALACDSAGNLWVVDAANNRVEKFNANGEYVSKFGSGGTGNGQFSEPEGIAIDPKGNIWVADTNNGRIEKFNSSGTFVKVVGSKGTGPGQLGEPAGIDIGIGGNVFAADWPNSRVSVFNEAGEFVRQFGTEGSGQGQLKQPHGIEVDSEGRVWVADQANSRIQEFNEDGKYIAQFGSNGTSEGQFKLSSPSGIATSTFGGSIWVTDTDNNRIQKWSVPQPEDPLLYANKLGSSGAGNGQLSRPLSVAIDAQGNAWVADSINNRIEKFDSKGEYLSQFGSSGSGNGQFSRPTSVAIDAKSNVLVVDSNNARVQKFSSSGQYLSKFGSAGSGNGQLNGPEGIAIDAKGNIWVSDTLNGRVQKFSEGGAFLKAVGSKGSAPGQLDEPGGLAVGPGGNVWVADTKNNRVSVFNEIGEYIGKIGGPGTSDGLFDRPEAVAVESRGGVWVTDQTGRVQQFGQSGRYVAKFGSKGSGEGQFSPGASAGVAADAQGSIWVADAMNDRVQRWHAVRELPSSVDPGIQDDPAVEVDVSNGFVKSVEGDEAGDHAYWHEGSRLVSHEGPQGETAYQYDGSNRLTEVALPNGTMAYITYNATYGRVSSVTVDPAGPEPAKTTHFTFQDEPRRTTVEPPDAPVITYDIGADGSVLKWWNSESPPDFDNMGGTLYDNRETPQPIAVLDYNLVTQAHSEEGISSIMVVANGTNVVDERTCEQDFETPGTECVTFTNEWVTSTGNWPPGILDLEVIITDRLGHQASERFWVNIPYTPPPAPDVPQPPKFEEIVHFREEFGLDLDLKGDELAIDDRIFDLIGAWYNPQTPEGEVARATQERWGVPLRAVDAAELEYRQAYIEQAAALIPEWASAHAAATYAGYYVDHRQGGLIHVGFTQNQSTNVAALKSGVGLIAPSRVVAFSAEPHRTYFDLATTQGKIASSASSLPSFTQAPLEVKDNVVKVGTTGSVAGMTAALQSLLGSTASVSAFYDTNPPGGNAQSSGRGRLAGRVQAGDEISNESVGYCTAGFGTWLEQERARGERLFKHFLLAAGHCGGLDEEYIRGKYNPKSEFFEYQTLGRVRRFGLEGVVKVDGAAILLQGEADGWAPRQIYLTANTTQPITGVALPTPGMLVCTSGVTTNKTLCGQVLGPPVPFSYINFSGLTAYEIPIGIYERPGDSGAPVWQAGTGNAVGLWNAGTEPSFVTTLLPYPVEVEANYSNLDWAPGILAKLGFQPGNLSVSK